MRRASHPLVRRPQARHAPLEGVLCGALLLTALWSRDALADAPAMAQEKSTVRPAAERAVVTAPRKKEPTLGVPSKQASGITLGPKIPEHLRNALALQIAQRIDRDVAGQKLLRVEATGLLETFIREEPKVSREMPEALMRLGELRWEGEREAYVARFQTWEKRPVDQRGPAPEPDFGPARALFAKVLADYPQFESYDLALYVDGFLATEQGNEEEALLRWNRILSSFPSSRFRADAYMARAEAKFNGHYDYAHALSDYENVMRFPGSDLFGLALFKSAWCYWRLGNSDDAAKRFLRVFQVTDPGAKVSAQKRKQLDELQAEALKYLVEVFTEDERNSADDMYQFLVKAGGDKFAAKIVRALATAFYEQAHYERGIEAYELLLKLDPASPEAPGFALAIAQARSTLEDWPKLQSTYTRILNNYTAAPKGDKPPLWVSAQESPQVVERARARIEKQFREDAVALHAKAQKDKTSRAEFEGAVALYDIYLSRFGGGTAGYEIEFSDAEILFYHLGRPSEAATHYLAAVRKNPKGPLSHDALYNAIAALERARAAELEKGATAASETEVDRKFTEAMELYVQLYPNDPGVPELLFRQGKLYYDHGIYDPAVRQWGLLLERYPSSKFAAGAGELTLDSFNRSKDYTNIETWARRLKTAPSFQTVEQQRKLDTLIVQAVFKQGEQKGAAGEHAEAAQAYLRAAKEFPRDPRAAQACVNAELEAQRAQDVTTMRVAADLLLASHRDAKEAPLGLWTAATLLQSMGLLSESAVYHEALFESFPKSEHGRDAGFNAVTLRTAVGDYDKAIANGRRYRQAFPQGEGVDEVVLMMGKSHEGGKKWREAADLYRSYIRSTKSADRKAEAYVHLATVLMKSGNEREADAALADAVALSKQKGALSSEGKYAAAHARYLQGERVLGAFEQIQIAGDLKQLSGRLKQKAELLKQAATIFLECVSMGVAEWSTASLYQIGHTYESFAAALRAAPPPSGFSEGDKEAYQTQIDEFVVPIEEKSLDAYENGWKKAVELGIFNHWTAKMREALGRLNGELYPPQKEIGFAVRSQAPFALPALSGGVESGKKAAEPPPAKKAAGARK